MSEGAKDVPLDEASGHLADVVGQATHGGQVVYLTDHGHRVAAIVPTEEAWFWTPGWQAAEAEADADIREGRTRTYDSMDDMFAEFDAVRGESAE